MSKTNHQMHGKSFENFIKASNNIFSYATADRKRSSNERFDIGADDDIHLKIPTSIKATGSNTIALSDARNFWESIIHHTPYRVIVGHYQQDKIKKNFYQISMFVLTLEHKDVLLGDVTFKEIQDFHDGLKDFKEGKHKEARIWAKEQKLTLQNRLQHLILNPKIDSKNQRRLQCSIKMDSVKTITDIDVFNDSFGSLSLPFSIISGKRR